MEKKILLLLVVITFKSFAQDTITYKPTHSQIFSLSPISKKVDKVNGFVFGVGHYENKNIQKQTINGLNVEASPIGLLAPIILLYSFEKKPSVENYFKDIEKIKLKINGLSLSSGGFLESTDINGFNICLVSRMNNMTGISFSIFYLASRSINGISVSGLENYFYSINGLSIGLVNKTFDLKGIQFGLYNCTQNQMIGVQLGIVNISNKTKGLQIGLLNINKKRAFPFINF
jgi:hypothetical protein